MIVSAPIPRRVIASASLTWCVHDRGPRRVGAAALAAMALAVLGIPAVSRARGDAVVERQILVGALRRRQDGHQRRRRPGRTHLQRRLRLRDVVSSPRDASLRPPIGPIPKNPTLPQPSHYVWDGTRWVEHFDFQWDCYRGEGIPKSGHPRDRGRSTPRVRRIASRHLAHRYRAAARVVEPWRMWAARFGPGESGRPSD